MNRIIRKVAVLGAGIMGARIACHFANTGTEVLLLDRAFQPGSGDQEESLSGSREEFKNRLVHRSLEEAVKSDPSPLYKKEYVSRIKAGNFDEDLPLIRDYDWIIEAVVEDADIKKILFEKVEALRKEGTLVTTNTSGIPVASLCEGRSEDFRKHFCGTHFFNPPRYLPLLEIIPAPQTEPEVIHFLGHYGSLNLGKHTLVCKDTPGFIANRIGVYGILRILELMNDLDLSIDEIDKLTGPVAGRPKSGTFRTSDLVGLDTLIKVANNLYASLPSDENREAFRLPGLIYDLEKKNWLGDKTRQGFYKKIKNAQGESEILTLDLKDLEYKPRKKAKFSTLETARVIDHLRDRLPVLYGGKDKAGEFYRKTFRDLFRYISLRIPEITDEFYKIDEALCAGFGWELGPFETWDILGVERVVMDMENSGQAPAVWVRDMIAGGMRNFYTAENGIRKFYDIHSGTYQPIPGKEGIIILDDIRKSKLVWGNSGCSVIDLGDGILNIEFHTKMNTMGSEVIEGINKGIDLAEKDFRGVVIGNNGQNFSVGANLGILFMLAIEQDYEEIHNVVRAFQQTIMRVRYSGIPVVVAPHDLCLGGGCEMTLHADQVQAAAESYIGLVEVGVGLLPAGGGTKEMTRRIAEQYETGDTEFNTLQNIFTNIAMGKVATSAREAVDMKYLQPGNGITINRERLIAEAKASAIRLSESGYTMPDSRRNIRVQGRPGMALFLAGIHGLKSGKFITEHDAKIAAKIAWVMCGGDLSAPAEVSETYLLDLEREAFLSLCGERKTLERIEAILQGKKPLRN